MKSSNTASALILAFLFSFSSLLAQDERYDAWYTSLVKEYTLNPDGSMDYRYIKDQKLLTYRAFHNLYGETFVLYNPTYQQLKINEDFTVMADGKKIVAPENSFNEVLPGFAANAPDYNGLREMVITHTALERNATIHLDYTIHTDRSMIPALMGNELLAENEPVKNLEIRVCIPSGQTLHHRLFNLEAKPVVSSDGKFQIYTWKLVDVPAISLEEMQQGANELYPRLIFSTSGKREEVYSFLTSQPAFNLTLNDNIKKEINDLATKNKDRLTLALKLQEKVVNDLRLTAVPLKYALYQCRTPEQTWNSNYGTVVEKAVLLTAMLKSAGMDAQVAGIVRTPFTDDHIGTLADIEDFAVKLENRERGTWYLSVSALNPGNLKLTLPGRTFISLKNQVKPEVFKSEAPKMMVKVIGNFIFSSDPKLTGEISIYYVGSAYALAGLIRDPKRMKNSITGGLIGNDTNNLKVSTLNNENGFQSFIVQSDKPFRKDSNYFSFSVPVSNAGIESWGIKTLSTKREKPIEITSMADESYTYTVVLPSGFKLFTPPKKLAISNKAGDFLWEVKTEAGKVTVKKELKFSSRIFGVADYEDFKKLMDSWNNPWYRQLVFVKE